jgi:hypothetical protein
VRGFIRQRRSKKRPFAAADDFFKTCASGALLVPSSDLGVDSTATLDALLTIATDARRQTALTSGIDEILTTVW